MSQFQAGKAVIDFVVNDKALRGLSARVRRSLGGVVKQLQKVKITARQLFFVGAGAASAGAVAFKFVKAYADAEETLSKFAAVFKEETDAAALAADELANRIGRSAIGIKGFLATLQDTFVPLGFARDQARLLSQQVVELSFDLASFNNIPVADVIRDIQSALVGNVETLRKYGVVINQTRLNQQLLTDGVDGGVKKATEFEKAMGRLNILLASTTDAQGDATRTAASLANRFNALAEAAKDAAISIGESLVTLAGSDSLADALGSFTAKLRAFNNELQRNADIRRGLQQQDRDFGNAEDRGGGGAGSRAARTLTDPVAEILGRIGLGLGQTQLERELIRMRLQQARDILEIVKTRAAIQRRQQFVAGGGFAGMRDIETGRPLDMGENIARALLEMIDRMDGGMLLSRPEDMREAFGNVVRAVLDKAADAATRAVGLIQSATIGDREADEVIRSRVEDRLKAGRKELLRQRAALGEREAQIELELMRIHEEYLAARARLLPIIMGQTGATEQQIAQAKAQLAELFAQRARARQAAKQADTVGRGARFVDPTQLVRDIQTQVLSGVGDAQERAARAAQQQADQGKKANDLLGEGNQLLKMIFGKIDNDEDGGPFGR